MKKRILSLALLLMVIVNVNVAQNVGDIGEVKDVDNNVYETKFMKDGNWWMMENLKTTKYADGTAVAFYYPHDVQKDASGNLISDTELKDLVDKGAGLLYKRNEVMKGWPFAIRGQGVCPNGWHVPNDFEIMNLNVLLGGSNVWADWDGASLVKPFFDALEMGAAYGGTYDPDGNHVNSSDIPADRETDFPGWGPAIYMSKNPYNNESDAYMYKWKFDGVVSGTTQDPRNIATNCRCLKNKAVTVTTTKLNDNGMYVKLSHKILNKVNQVMVYNVTNENDAWDVDLTSVVFSQDSLGINISAYLEVSAGEKYEVRFTDAVQTSIPIGGYDISYELVLGIKNDAHLNIDVYPNPTANFIVISGSNLQSVELFNASGAMVLAKKLGTDNSIDISNLNKGLYLVKVTSSKGENYTEQIIKE